MSFGDDPVITFAMAAAELKGVEEAKRIMKDPSATPLSIAVTTCWLNAVVKAMMKKDLAPPMTFLDGYQKMCESELERRGMAP